MVLVCYPLVDLLAGDSCAGEIAHVVTPHVIGRLAGMFCTAQSTDVLHQTTENNLCGTSCNGM